MTVFLKKLQFNQVLVVFGPRKFDFWSDEKIGRLLYENYIWYIQNMQKWSHRLASSNHSNKFEIFSFGKNHCKDKRMELIELSGYTLEDCSSKLFEITI